jgi:hypothetical protein
MADVRIEKDVARICGDDKGEGRVACAHNRHPALYELAVEVGVGCEVAAGAQRLKGVVHGLVCSV